jgi:ribose transport system permease protein
MGLRRMKHDHDRVFRNALKSPAGRALIALAMILLLGVVFHADGAFFKIGTHRDALRQASVYGILACGMTLVIITAGIDLAVGSILALAAVCFAKTSIHWQWSPLLALLACVAVGAACGAVSGVIIARLRVQPFVATLAMMAFARGLVKFLPGGAKVSTAVQNPDGTYRYVDVPAVFSGIDNFFNLSTIFQWFGWNATPAWVPQWVVRLDATVLGTNISVVSVIFLLCAAVSWLALSHHRWGRQLYAIGGNEEAARLSGIPVVRAKIFAYVAAGAFAAIAGICQAAQEQQGDPEAGTGYELIAIAMVVVGGTNLMGGRGGIGLTLIGVLTIGYLEKILSINAIPEAVRLMLTGVIIVAAVLTQRGSDT